MQPTQIKICGITNERDALASIEAGAHLLGFNFYARSPRLIEIETARAMVAKVKSVAPQILCVGVFVNHTPTEIKTIADTTRIDYAQLHGDETATDCAQIDFIPVIKALRVRSETEALRAAQEFAAVPLLLLDAWRANAYGGTGHTGDWNAARSVVENGNKVFLAGGLNPENVVTALDAVRPYGADVCSGIEAAPGIKDEQKMRAFCDAIRQPDKAKLGFNSLVR